METLEEFLGGSGTGRGSYDRVEGDLVNFRRKKLAGVRSVGDGADIDDVGGELGEEGRANVGEEGSVAIGESDLLFEKVGVDVLVGGGAEVDAWDDEGQESSPLLEKLANNVCVDKDESLGVGANWRASYSLLSHEFFSRHVHYRLERKMKPQRPKENRRL